MNEIDERLKLVQFLRECAIVEISSSNRFIITINIINGNNKITAPSVKFVVNDYSNESNESFNLAFKEDAEIERRLNDLKQFNKQILIN